MANFFQNIFTKNSKLTVDQLIVKKTIVSFFFFFVFCGAAILGMEMATGATLKWQDAGRH